MPRKEGSVMPMKKRPGMVGLYVELRQEQRDRLQQLVDSLPLGGIADHVRLAIDRHLDNPPTVGTAELPATRFEAPPTNGPTQKKAAKKLAPVLDTRPRQVYTDTVE
jgi:hypothetical protein